MGDVDVRVTPSGVEFVRTPEERFVDLVDWPYEPRYTQIDDLRMAFVDEGATNSTDSTDSPTLLLLHGEPTWGYLYRRMVPKLVGAGYRVIVPDLIGFGRSDKPTNRSTYTYAGHVAWMTEFVRGLGVGDLTLFCQDWGGLIGLRVVAENPDLFSRLVIANSALPDGSPMSDGFLRWQHVSQQMEFMDCGRLLQMSTVARELSEAEMNAYRAPFPDENFMAGARAFPLLVPTSPDDPAVPANRAAWAVLDQWTKPVLTLWAPGDPVLGGYQEQFVQRIPGARGQPHQRFEPSGHFIQDDVGEPISDAIITWLG